MLTRFVMILFKLKLNQIVMIFVLNIMSLILNVLLAILAVTVLSQHPVNRILIRSSLDSQFGCWLTIRNNEELLDFRTNCPLGNTTEEVELNKLMQFISPTKAYLFTEMN